MGFVVICLYVHYKCYWIEYSTVHAVPWSCIICGHTAMSKSVCLAVVCQSGTMIAAMWVLPALFQTCYWCKCDTSHYQSDLLCKHLHNPSTSGSSMVTLKTHTDRKLQQNTRQSTLWRLSLLCVWVFTCSSHHVDECVDRLHQLRLLPLQSCVVAACNSQLLL